MAEKVYGQDTHENFFHEDIAIIKVNEPYDFTRSVSPICIPHKFMFSRFEENTLKIAKGENKVAQNKKQKKHHDIKTVHFMGTGEIDEEEGASDTLQHAELTILSPKNCLKEMDDELFGYLLLMQFPYSKMNSCIYMNLSYCMEISNCINRGPSQMTHSEEKPKHQN